MKYILVLVVLLLIVLLARFGELTTQPGRYQAYWTRQNQQPAQASELLYIALGDSAAQGVGANKPANGYVGYITRALEEKTDRPVRTLNFSKSGARVADALNNQLSKLENCNIGPDTVITIEIGANDMKDFEAGKFEREMSQLMGRLPKQTVISDIPYFGSGIARKSESNVQAANEIMRRLAAEHGFTLAGLYDRTKNNSGPRTFAADWFHPSADGYKTNWAPAFLERINGQ